MIASFVVIVCLFIAFSFFVIILLFIQYKRILCINTSAFDDQMQYLCFQAVYGMGIDCLVCIWYRNRLCGICLQTVYVIVSGLVSFNLNIAGSRRLGLQLETGHTSIFSGTRTLQTLTDTTDQSSAFPATWTVQLPRYPFLQYKGYNRTIPNHKRVKNISTNTLSRTSCTWRLSDLYLDNAWRGRTAGCCLMTMPITAQCTG